MPQQSRDIQRRLKTVRNIRKITRAMELVAAAKMRKSVNRVLSSRTYADAAWDLVLDLIPKIDRSHHPLLEERPVKKVAIVIVSSNRGLCGAFNMNVVSKALDLVDKQGWTAETQVDFITLGKKGAQILVSLKRGIAMDYPKDDITDSLDDITPITAEILEGFVQKRYDEVCLVYTHFHSSIRQEARVRYLLPLFKPSRYLGHVDESNGATENKIDFSEYLFEPNRDEVLERVLPRLVELQMYQAVLETEASEHSARMMAMHNATESAAEMIDSLTLAYNQARQAGITAELAEITAAVAAVQ